MARVDLGGAASNAVSGTATGLGLAGVPGAVAGGVLGLFGGLLGGRKKKKKRSTLDKRQQMINQQQQQGLMGQGPLADLYNYDPEKANAVFDKTVGRPAYRNFQENIVPGITGSFRKHGLEESGYVTDALGKAGRDVQEGLDAQRSQYLYGQESEAREAKRSAVENYQNRNTQERQDRGEGGFDIASIIKSIPPEAVKGVIDYFKKNPGAAGGV